MCILCRSYALSASSVVVCFYAVLCFIGLDSFLLFFDLLFQSLGFCLHQGVKPEHRFPHPGTLSQEINI